MHRRAILFATAATVASAACDHPDPRAGLITSANASEIVPPGETAVGKPGDLYLRNELATFIIQGPGHELALGPCGGTLVDLAVNGGRDHFGELIPVFALGRTLQVYETNVLSDGSDGAPALIEALGWDVANVYYNIRGIEPELLSYIPEGGGLLGYNPDASMNLKVRVLYSLPTDEPRLSIKYVFENTGTRRQGVPLGFLIDSRGSVESFMLGNGFKGNLTKSLDPDQLLAMLTAVETTDMALLINDEMSIGIVPRRVNEKQPPRVIGDTVPTLGAALLIEAKTAIDAASEPSFSIEPGETAEVELDILIGERPQDIIERGWELIGVTTAGVSGCVARPGGEPAPNVRVGLTHSEKGTIATYRTNERGCFEGRVPPGRYQAVAGTLFHEPSDEVCFDVPGSVDLTLGEAGQLQVQVDVFNAINATAAGRHPCRLTLIGTPQVVSHPALGDGSYQHPGGQVHRLVYLRHCRETVEVSPGRYLAIVTRGPEFSKLERVVEVVAGETAEVFGTIYRVVDTQGYAASDFHVHSVYSPDSNVPAADRVLTLAAEGLDFWASTDHDVISDYTGHIREVGLEDELLTIPGSEVTTFESGHFNAFPLARDWAMANGGSPDWAVGIGGVRPTMQELFDSIHARGAFIQVNHPRRGGIGLGAYFSRAGMSWDSTLGHPYADPQKQKIPNDILRYEPGVIYFSDDFDIIEVQNGAGTHIITDATTGISTVWGSGARRQGQDWMNFLSWGRKMIGVANSDTHTTAKPPGNARSYVGGHARGAGGLIEAIGRGDVVMSTGPMVRAMLVDEIGQSASLGDTLEPAGSQVTLRVHVESADWYEVTALDVIANAFFPDTEERHTPEPAVPPVVLEPVLVPRANGGVAQVAAVEIPLDLQAAPFYGEDSWIVVNVGGPGGILYPTMFGGGGTLNLMAQTPEEFLSGRHGPRAWALTNAIYVDQDGYEGWH